jgi:hypothetical protein
MTFSCEILSATTFADQSFLLPLMLTNSSRSERDQALRRWKRAASGQKRSVGRDRRPLSLEIIIVLLPKLFAVLSERTGD